MVGLESWEMLYTIERMGSAPLAVNNYLHVNLGTVMLLFKCVLPGKQASKPF